MFVIDGKVNQARQVVGGMRDKERHHGPPGWGFGVGLVSWKHQQRKIMYRIRR